MNIFAKVVEDNISSLNDRIPDKIDENLYIGNMFNASDKSILKELKITHILIFASDIEPSFPLDFIYKQIDVHDLPNFNICSYFEESYK